MQVAGQSLFPDSIYALSSGGLPSGVAVIRLSGSYVPACITAMAGSLPAPRQASLRTLISPAGDPIDRGLVLFFPAPASFTGEDCAELHLHGGKAVVAAAVEAINSQPGFRLAEAGEFTRRAFLNGKMDLTSAEGIADLVAAETESQRRLALENASGRQHALYAEWRRRLLHARAMVEAELDFSDEGDVPGSVSKSVWADMARLADEIGDHIDGYRAAQIVRDGFRVVVAGAPNAGKSSLVNALAQRDVAIVTDIPGTTRDVVEVTLDLGGIKVILSDTAGFRFSDDTIEMIGVDRARAAIREADLVLHLVAPGGSPDDEILALAPSALLVQTKTDLVSSMDLPQADHRVSSMTGAGMNSLLDDITAHALALVQQQPSVLPTRLRHRSLLADGRERIIRALAQNAEDELRAEELRLAERSLGQIIGASDVEDVLGEIFSRFCIGK